jgi:hypothetical protein
VQQAGALGAEAGQVCDRDQARRELGPQPLRSGDRAGVDEREDLLLQRLADARQLGCTALAGERGDRHGRRAHGLGGGPIGDDAVDDRAVELVQVAELLQCVGDRSV